MEKMNEITLSSDKKVAAIGPGNRWGAVYGKLGEQGLAVLGGRVILSAPSVTSTC